MSGNGRRLRMPAGGSGPAAAVLPAEIPGLRALLTLQVAVVVVTALWFGAEICIPVTLAVLLSFLLQPLNARLRRWHFGRWPSASLSVLLALALAGGLLWLIGAQAVGLAHELAADQAIIEGKLDSLHRFGSSGVSMESLDRLRLQVSQLLAGTRGAPSPIAGGSRPPMPVQVIEPDPTPMAMAGSLMARLAHPLATALVVFVVSIFILLQREDLRDRMIRLFGTRDLHRTTLALDDAGSRLSRYFLTQLAINAGFGCLIAGGLFAIGVPSPVLWGILAMLLRFVPYFGTLLAAVPPLLLASASFSGWNHTVETLALFLLVEPLVAQFVEPMLIGHSTGLSPISIVVAAAFWTWLWGPIGLILSTPLTLCCVVLGRHVERLEFLDVLLGDQPALSPVESFYQRMLADDPDEIAEQAEGLLEEMALSTYYDDVVVEAMQLASRDARRGVLEDAHLARMQDALSELVAELDTYDDADPLAAVARTPVASHEGAGSEQHRAVPPRLDPRDAVPAWCVPQPVLCVPGSFPLDVVAARILVQILNKHGIGARIVPNAATSRAAIGQLSLDGTAMICLCALGIEHRLSPLRYTARRLAQHAPGLPIAVAFWPGGEIDEMQRRTRQAVAADHHAQSLREMVSICLDAALAGGGERNRVN